MEPHYEPDLPSLPIDARPVLPRRRRWPVYLVVAFVALVALSGVGFAAATALEERDTFCIACHTAPEITYYNRAYLALDNPTAALPDLSTAHYRAAQEQNAPFRCIDCHRGDSSLGHRLATFALGAYDAVIFFTGREDPTIEKHDTKTAWLANASCIGCHTSALLELDGINNHFHTYLPQARTALDQGGELVIGEALRAVLAREEAAANDAERTSPGPLLETIDVEIHCSACHQPHKALIGGATSFFMDASLRDAACVECHVIAQQGPQDARELSGEAVE